MKVGCNVIWISPTVQWSREDWCSPVGKLHYLWGFIFFAPFGFWRSCCPRVNSSFAAPSSMNHFISQLGLHFGVADQWMRKKTVVPVGVVFFLLAQPVKCFDPEQQKEFCVVCSHLGPISNTHFCDFFHQEKCLVALICLPPSVC